MKALIVKKTIKETKIEQKVEITTTIYFLGIPIFKSFRSIN